LVERERLIRSPFDGCEEGPDFLLQVFDTLSQDGVDLPMPPEKFLEFLFHSEKFLAGSLQFLDSLAASMLDFLVHLDQQCLFDPAIRQF